MSVQIFEQNWSAFNTGYIQAFSSPISESTLNISQIQAISAHEQELETIELPTLQLIRQDSSPAEYFQDSPNHALNSQLEDFRGRFSQILGKLMHGKNVTQGQLENFKRELLNSDAHKEAAVKVLVIKVEKMIKDIKSGRHRYVPRQKKVIKSCEEEEENSGLSLSSIHKIYKF